MIYSDNYSIGCKSCQKGRWLCVFLTYLCEGSCDFCPSPFKQEDIILSAFGNDPEIVLDYLKKIKTFEGISFSGGDSFLVFDRLIDWLTFFKIELPNIYYWVYTNGLNVSRDKLTKLSKAGLNEIRFNIAATGYKSLPILEIIKTASNIIENVAVEIPSIPEDLSVLKEILPSLEKSGVKYLNLHQYILPDEKHIELQSKKNVFILNKQNRIFYDMSSLENTEKIKKYCKNEGINIKINNCTLDKKENQMLNRRKIFGQLFREEYESINSYGLLETIFTISEDLDRDGIIKFLSSDKNRFRQFLIHPDKFEKNKVNNNKNVFKIQYIPPLSIEEERVIYKIDKIKSRE